MKHILSLLFFLVLTVAAGAVAPADANGALPGRFSVSSSRHVQFARGNLYYDSSYRSWSFFKEQYTADGSSAHPGCIIVDLFPFADCEQGEHVSIDYGKKRITNGGTNAGWHLLSEAEWEYLLTKRPRAKQLAGLAIIRLGGGDLMYGMVLLPDAWKPVSGVSFIPGAGDATQNIYSRDQWQQLEAAGAVFLPAVGEGIEGENSYFNEAGCYLTSTWRDDDLCDSLHLVFTRTFTGSVEDDWDGPMHRSVRLARYVD